MALGTGDPIGDAVAQAELSYERHHRDHRKRRRPRGMALWVSIILVVFFVVIFVIPLIQAFWYSLNIYDIQTGAEQWEIPAAYLLLSYSPSGDLFAAATWYGNSSAGLFGRVVVDRYRSDGARLFRMSHSPQPDGEATPWAIAVDGTGGERGCGKQQQLPIGKRRIFYRRQRLTVHRERE